MIGSMNTCPHCAEDAKDSAVVCTHCGWNLMTASSRWRELQGALTVDRVPVTAAGMSVANGRCWSEGVHCLQWPSYETCMGFLFWTGFGAAVGYVAAHRRGFSPATGVVAGAGVGSPGRGAVRRARHALEYRAPAQVPVLRRLGHVERTRVHALPRHLDQRGGSPSCRPRLSAGRTTRLACRDGSDRD